MFEGSKQIQKFRLKKLLIFEHLWCPHWNKLQQLLLHQPHTSSDSSSYQTAIFVQKTSSSENSFINSFSLIKALLVLLIHACVTVFLSLKKTSFGFSHSRCSSVTFSLSSNKNNQRANFSRAKEGNPSHFLLVSLSITCFIMQAVGHQKETHPTMYTSLKVRAT